MIIRMRRDSHFVLTPFLIFLCFHWMGAGCSPAPLVVQTQSYAQLSSHRIYESDLTTVWKAIETVFRPYPILERQPLLLTPLLMKSCLERSLKTDWIYSQSRERSVEYQTNGAVPHKIYLQTRFQLILNAQKVLGGTRVHIHIHEEIEKLNPNHGTSEGYEKTEADSSRAAELLNKINMAILAAPVE